MKNIKKVKNTESEKRGSALLLALVITMIVLTTAGVLGALIVSSIRRTQGQSVAISAYYASESVIERALYDLRKLKKRPSDISFLCTTLPGITTDMNCVGKVDYDLMANLGALKKNASTQIKVIGATETDSAGAQSLKVRCFGSSGLWIEITRHTVKSSDGFGPEANKGKIEKSLYSCPATFLYYPDMPYINLNPNNAYIVTIKALYNDTSGITVTAYSGVDGGGSAIPIGDYFTMTATAEYGLFSGQNIRVKTAGASSISSLFDYVLYSESTISKCMLAGNTGGTC